MILHDIGGGGVTRKQRWTINICEGIESQFAASRSCSFNATSSVSMSSLR